MRLMGLEAIDQAPRTSDPYPAHRIYPYLLRGMEISRPNQVWCSDITYIPVQHGFLYLVEIMDWATGNPHGVFGTPVSLSWLFKHVAFKSLGVEALRLLGLR
jgi:hypothetical protein